MFQLPQFPIILVSNVSITSIPYYIAVSNVSITSIPQNILLKTFLLKAANRLTIFI
jgi:hypothetical protein